MKLGNQKRILASSAFFISLLVASASIAQSPTTPASEPAASPTAKPSVSSKSPVTAKPAASPIGNPSLSPAPTWNFWQITAGNWVTFTGVIITIAFGFWQWRKSNRLEREKLEWQQKFEQDKLAWERDKLQLQHGLD